MPWIRTIKNWVRIVHPKKCKPFVSHYIFLLAKSLLTNDILQEVMQRYSTLIVKSKSKTDLPSNNLLTPSSTPSNAELLTSIMELPPPISTSKPLPSLPLNIPLTDPLAGDLDDLFLPSINQTNQTTTKPFDNDLLLMNSSSNIPDVGLASIATAFPVEGSLLQPKVLGKFVPSKKWVLHILVLLQII